MKALLLLWLASPVWAEPLTLEAYVQQAAASDPTLESQRLDAARAKHRVGAAARPFAPTLRLVTEAESTHGTLRDDGSPVGRAQISVSQLTRAGTALKAELSHQISADGAPGTDHQTGAALTVSQPLLRGLTPTAQADEARAALQAEMAALRFEGEADDFVADAARRYLRWAYTVQATALAERAVARAKAQFEETQAHIERGLLAPTERLIVEESLVSFEQSRLSAVEAEAQAAADLARLTGGAPLRLPTEAALDAPPALAKADEPLADALARQAKHPQIAAAQLEAKLAGVTLALTEDQARPRLDLEATLRASGADDGPGGAMGTLTQGEDRLLLLGLTLDTPLTRQGERDAVAEAALARRQAALTLAERLLTLTADQTDAARRLSAERAKLALAKRVVELASAKLSAEQEKYKSGISTLADVVRFQRELDAASQGEATAALEVLLALVERARLRGGLASAFGLTVMATP